RGRPRAAAPRAARTRPPAGSGSARRRSRRASPCAARAGRAASATTAPPGTSGANQVGGTLFPPEPAALPVARPDLVHRRGVVQPAVDHRVGDALAVADVFERVAVDHDQVGELAWLERAD